MQLVTKAVLSRSSAAMRSTKFKTSMGKRGQLRDPLLTGSLAMILGWEYDYPEDRSDGGPVGVAPLP
ncbi:hypothetical protein LJR153_007162 [Paenibacillus sp. LjRoot153]